MKTTKKRKTTKKTTRYYVEKAFKILDYQAKQRKFSPKEEMNQRNVDYQIAFEQALKQKSFRNVKDKKGLTKKAKEVIRDYSSKNVLSKKETQDLLENFYGEEDTIEKKMAEKMLRQLTDKELEEFLTSGYGSVRMDKDYYTKYENDLKRLNEKYNLDFLTAAIKSFIAKKRPEGDLEAEKIAVMAQITATEGKLEQGESLRIWWREVKKLKETNPTLYKKIMSDKAAKTKITMAENLLKKSGVLK